MKPETGIRERAISLMGSVLRDGAAITPEYPLIFGDEGSGDVIAVEDEGDVRSACTTLTRDFLVDELTVRGGLIGSVSTAPEYRGRGLATRTLLDAEDQLSADGCHFALLWADDAEFYLTRGWLPIGAEVDFSIDASKRAALPRCDSVRLVAAGDAAAIHALYTAHPLRIDRRPAETEALLATPGVEVLVAESSGEIDAYACMGRGVDLQHVVHEWAGPVDAVLGLVRSHMEREMLRKEPGGVFLMTPPTAVELHAELEALGCEKLVGILGLGKLLGVETTMELLEKVAGPDLRLGRVSESRGVESVHLDGPRASLTIPREDLLPLLFGARGDRFVVEQVERACGVSLPKLPLAPFAWGLDSI